MRVSERVWERIKVRKREWVRVSERVWEYESEWQWVKIKVSERKLKTKAVSRLTIVRGSNTSIKNL